MIFFVENLAICLFFNYLVKLKQKIITMKKLFLVATIMVAGSMSANTISSETEIVEENATVKVEAAAAYGCVPTTLSCGITGMACGETLADVIDIAIIADDILCGN